MQLSEREEAIVNHGRCEKCLDYVMPEAKWRHQAMCPARERVNPSPWQEALRMLAQAGRDS